MDVVAASLWVGDRDVEDEVLDLGGVLGNGCQGGGVGARDFEAPKLRAIASDEGAQGRGMDMLQRHLQGMDRGTRRSQGVEDAGVGILNAIVIGTKRCIGDVWHELE